MRAINVWAWQEDLTEIPDHERVPVCSDGSRNLSELAWHMALPFANLSDLARKLQNLELPGHIGGEPRNLQRGELQRLAIDCHGSVGRFYPNGLIHGRQVDARTWTRDRDAIRDIGLMTSSRSHMAQDPHTPGAGFAHAPSEHPASSIFIMACNTGGGRAGSALLRALSHQWPGRQVVAFSVTVVFPQPSRPDVRDAQSGEQCLPPIVLDSGLRHVEGTGQGWMEEHSPEWSESPSRIPFALATSDNAKVAQSGVIIRVPANENPDGSPRHAQLAAPSFNGPPRGNLIRPTTSMQSERSMA